WLYRTPEGSTDVPGRPRKEGFFFHVQPDSRQYCRIIVFRFDLQGVELGGASRILQHRHDRPGHGLKVELRRLPASSYLQGQEDAHHRPQNEQGRLRNQDPRRSKVIKGGMDGQRVLSRGVQQDHHHRLLVSGGAADRLLGHEDVQQRCWRRPRPPEHDFARP
ncbi:unnamed protein product, partial [Polarella glacialis]